MNIENCQLDIFLLLLLKRNHLLKFIPSIFKGHLSHLGLKKFQGSLYLKNIPRTETNMTFFRLWKVIDSVDGTNPEPPNMMYEPPRK